MSVARERPETSLTPEAAGLIDAYFARVHGALLVAAAGGCEEAVEDLRTHVLEELEGSAGTSADVTRVLASLGSPEALATQCAEVADDGAATQGAVRSILSGRVLGIPFELRPPTPERIASSWWDPLNPRVFTPRVFGIGWTVNFGAVAVKLGLVRPDDEEAPFGEVPGRWLLVALALPLVAAAGLAVLAALFQAGLPSQVATHWSPSGAPDGFSSKEVALLLPAGMTLFGLVVAVRTWVRRRPPLSRVAAGALATMLAGISVGAYGQSLAAAQGDTGTAVLFAALAATFVSVFALMVVLSRVGRAAEQRRDLKKTSEKGSVR